MRKLIRGWLLEVRPVRSPGGFASYLSRPGEPSWRFGCFAFSAEAARRKALDWLKKKLGEAKAA